MKILKLSPYCFPEQVSSTHLSNDLYEAYKHAGIETEIYCPTPTRGIDKETREKYKHIKYEERYDGSVKIYRFPMFREGRNPFLRAIRYILCNIIQYYKGCRAKGIDLIFAASTPPTQGLLCSLVKKRLKVPFIYNLQDIFPDSLVNTGLTKKGSLLWIIGRKIEDFTYRNADKIIVISDGMKRNIIAKGVIEKKIVVISNWIDLNAVHPVLRENNKLFDELNIDRSKFIVVYAGNLGEAQGADIILDVAVKLLSNKDIQFIIFGSGTRKQKMSERIIKEKIANVLITGLQPQERVSEVYSMGDVALVTCLPGMGSAGMPSKLWTIMACNTKIIASYDTESDLADVIRTANAGCCVEPGSVNALYEAILKAFLNWNNGIVQLTNIREYALNNASKEICVQQYIDTLLNAVNKL